MSIYEQLSEVRAEIKSNDDMPLVYKEDMLGMLTQLVGHAFENDGNIPKFFYLITPHNMKMELVQEFLEQKLKLEIEEIKYNDNGRYCCSSYFVRLI